MISEQDVQAYQRDGVIVVPEVLGAETLAEVRTVIAELVAGSASTLEHTDVYDLEPGHTAETRASAASRRRTRCIRCSTRSCAAPPCSTSSPN